MFMAMTLELVVIKEKSRQMSSGDTRKAKRLIKPVKRTKKDTNQTRADSKIIILESIINH